MPIYIAMLRGINVGGHKIIKMDRLRESFCTLGFEQVQTYIQSGNVVFQARKTSAPTLSKKIEVKILADYGFPVAVVCRSADEMQKAIADNPFMGERGIDPLKIHVLFLSDTPASSNLRKVEGLAALPDRLHGLGKEIYFYLPNGVANSILMKKPLDRLLAVSTTARNWRTVTTLHQMCQDCQ